MSGKKAPAPKAPASAAPAAAPNGNGSASTGKGKGKKDAAPAPPAAATEAPAPATSGHLTKPDQAAYQAEQDSVKKEIETLQAKLNAVKDKIALTSKDGPAAERRAALRAEQDGLRANQSNSKMSRGKLLDQIKAINENVAKKIKDLNAARSKAPFKTVAEVDNAIKALDKQVESGSMAIAQEKRALAEISSYKRARKAIEGFQAEQEAIEAERAKADELRKELDDPELKAASERYDAIKAELDEIKKESDEAFASRNKLFDERNELQKELTVLHDKRRESSARYREANDRYYQRVQEERARKAERYRAQRAAEEEEKRREIAERLREEAEAPAFEAEIEDCQTLIDYFGKLLSGGSGAVVPPPKLREAKADVAGVPKLELRTVEAPSDKGLVLRKKKGEDEENYFAGKSKAKKGGAASKPAPAADAAKPAALNVPLATLTALLTLSIPPPASHADVPLVIENLGTKKAWFEANQKRVTAENIAKAEERIRALDNKSQTKAAAADGNGHVADAATPSEEAAEEAPKDMTAPETVAAES